MGTRLNADQESQFEEDMRFKEPYASFYQEFFNNWGEYPNLDDPQYDYRGAWLQGIVPQRYSHDSNRFHWPDNYTDDQGNTVWLKSDDHPTRWMGVFQDKYNIDPNEASPALVQRAKEKGEMPQDFTPDSWVDPEWGTNIPVPQKGIGSPMAKKKIDNPNKKDTGAGSMLSPQALQIIQQNADNGTTVPQIKDKLLQAGLVPVGHFQDIEQIIMDVIVEMPPIPQEMQVGPADKGLAELGTPTPDYSGLGAPKDTGGPTVAPSTMRNEDLPAMSPSGQSRIVSDIPGIDPTRNSDVYRAPTGDLSQTSAPVMQGRAAQVAMPLGQDSIRATQGAVPPVAAVLNQGTLQPTVPHDAGRTAATVMGQPTGNGQLSADQILGLPYKERLRMAAADAMSRIQPTPNGSTTTDGMLQGDRSGPNGGVRVDVAPTSTIMPTPNGGTPERPGLLDRTIGWLRGANDAMEADISEFKRPDSSPTATVNVPGVSGAGPSEAGGETGGETGGGEAGGIATPSAASATPEVAPSSGIQPTMRPQDQGLASPGGIQPTPVGDTPRHRPATDGAPRGGGGSGRPSSGSAPGASYASTKDTANMTREEWQGFMDLMKRQGVSGFNLGGIAFIRNDKSPSGWEAIRDTGRARVTPPGVSGIANPRG